MRWHRIRLHLLRHPEQTAHEIGAVLGIPTPSVRHVLGVAYERGQVSRSPTAPYTWWLGGKTSSTTSTRQHGLGAVQLAVIEALKAASEPLSSAQIGGSLGLKRMSRDRALRRLERRGIIQRVQVRPGAAPRWRWAA